MSICIEENCGSRAEFICPSHGEGFCVQHINLHPYHEGATPKQLYEVTPEDIAYFTSMKQQFYDATLRHSLDRHISDIDRQISDLEQRKNIILQTLEKWMKEFIKDFNEAVSSSTLNINAYLKLHYWNDDKFRENPEKAYEFMAIKKLKDIEESTESIRYTIQRSLHSIKSINDPHGISQAAKESERIGENRSGGISIGNSRSAIINPELPADNPPQQIEVQSFQIVYKYTAEENMTIEKWVITANNENYYFKLFRSAQEETVEKYYAFEIELYSKFIQHNIFNTILTYGQFIGTRFIYSNYYSKTLGDDINDKRSFTEHEIIGFINNSIDILSAFKKEPKIGLVLYCIEPSWFAFRDSKYQMVDFRLGTLNCNQRYFAPELCETSTDKISPTSLCIYSMGVIALDMMQASIEDINTRSVNQILSGLIKGLPVSDKLKQILGGMLAFDRKSRIDLKNLHFSLNR